MNKSKTVKRSKGPRASKSRAVKQLKVEKVKEMSGASMGVRN